MISFVEGGALVIGRALGLKKGLIGKRLTWSLIVEGCEVKQTSWVRTPPGPPQCVKFVTNYTKICAT